MKKLLVLLVVLGVVGVANAGVIDLTITSLNGATVANTKSITANASDTIDFRIMWLAPSTEYLFGIQSFFDITGPGTLDWTGFTVATYDADNDLWTNVDIGSSYDRLLHVVAQEAGKTYIIEGASDKGRVGNGTSELWIVKNLKIHVDGPGQINVVLSNRGLGSKAVDASLNLVPWTYGNGIVINPQIPEPMTLMLLGLGSLFLVKRKK